MALKQIMLPIQSVKQSNELIRSKTNITNKTAGRLLACLIAQIGTEGVFDKEYSLPISKYLENANDGGSQQEQIKSALDALSGAKVWLEYIDAETHEKKDKYKIIPYFTSIEQENGIVTATFNPVMSEHLLQLKNYFTEYNLFEYLSLKSIYSQKLYELLKSWEHGNIKGYVEYSIQDLHDYLNLPPSLKSDFYNFRQRILAKAEKDINKNTSLTFEWEPVRRGRVVTSIKFKVKDTKRIKDVTPKKTLATAKAIKEEQEHLDLIAQARACAISKRGECDRHACSGWTMCSSVFLPQARAAKQ